MDEQVARERFERAVEEQEPDYERFFLARFLGLEFTYDDDSESLRIDLPVADFMYNPRGSLHGGVSLFLFDVSMGHLCKRYLSPVVTLELKSQFFWHVHEPCHVESRFLKKGRTVVYVESRLFDGDGRLAAHATGTLFRTG